MNEGIALNKASVKSNNFSKPNNQASRFDFVLWFLVLLLFAAGMGVTYYYRELASPLKVLVWVFVLLLSAGLISRTAKGKTIIEFAKKARVELRKVVWPTRQATIQATAIVGLIVVVMSLILWVIDSSLVWLASLATGQRG